MSGPVEQNRTVRLLKTSSRKMKHSFSGSGSSCGSVTTSVVGSPITRKPMGLKPKRKHPKKEKGKIKVLDKDGSDVTPQPLTQTEPDVPKRAVFFLDEGSDSETDLGKAESPTLLGSFTTTFPLDNATTQFTKGSKSLDFEENLSVLEMQRPQRFQQETESIKKVSEEMLTDLVNICLTETGTISLLDIPSAVMSEDAEGATAQKEHNRCYIELCKGKLGNDKFVDRSMQTFDSAPKSKHTQTDTVVTMEAGTMATNWDIYDSMHELTESTPDNEKVDFTETGTKTQTQKSKERHNRSSNTTGTDSTISSLPDIDLNADGSQSGPDLQTLMLSKKFQLSSLIMERNIVANIFQHKLAAYRDLPILQDPDNTEPDVPKENAESPAAPEDSPEVFNEESPVVPTLHYLWSFSCDLTKGCVVTSMSWHKENADILAVGYDSSASNKNSRGLICVWSLKNLTWPDRVLYSHCAVTTLDFSPSVPSHLGVGMQDGTVAIYDVVNGKCVASSARSSKRHLQQVCQVSWTKQVLVSVSVDGLIKTWLLSSKGLECTDLFQLRNVKNNKKEPVANKKKPQNILGGGVAPGLCFHFHPGDPSIYLAGTREGFIHKCSFSNRQYFLETYEKHFRPVNNIEWSPFSPDLFLSCSSDWTVQLWRQGSLSPVLGFSSSQTAVYAVRWAPKWPTVFAALKEEQLEIWDLQLSVVDPVVVHCPPAAVDLTAVLFALEADAVMVGDSSGEVMVYQLRNLSAEKDGQVVKLEDII